MKIRRRFVRAARFLLGAALCGVTLGACVSERQDASGYVRDGVRYGQTEGRFRGRWWNYYERGRSFSDGGFWAEAERDFRAAMLMRDRDQFWPRTYGLHFLPEYFPHRELGIALYQQDRLQEALPELESSLSQKGSARAGYFLDLARKTWVAKQQNDAAPPVLDVSVPAADSGAMTIELSGVARDDTFVSNIIIAGQPYLLSHSDKEIRFAKSVALRPGQNEFEVIAEDVTGKKTAATARVRADLDGPAISFDRPVTFPGVVRGVAWDSSSVSGVRIAGHEAALEAQADGTVAFSLELSRETSPPLSYEAKDQFGNVTQGNLTPDVVRVADVLPSVVFASDAVTVVPVAPKIAALMFGSQLVALAAVPDAGSGSAPRVQFSNLADGQQFRMDEIVVNVDVEAASAVQAVQLNGTPVDTIPGKNVQHVSRRVTLAQASNEISVAAQDAAGLRGEARVAVERVLTEIEQPDRKLAVTFLGNVWKGDNPKSAEMADFIVQTLEGDAECKSRFSIVARNQMPEILAEQELSAALASKDARLALGKLVPAEVMFIGTVRQDADGGTEIVLDGVSAETSVNVARADVFGRASNLDELEGLVKTLALRVAQEFPRVQGQVALVRNPSAFVTNLNSSQRVRESMKCVVFRFGEEIIDPATNVSLGRDTQVIAEALVRTVDAQKSAAEVSTSGEQAAEAIQRGDYVVTK